MLSNSKASFVFFKYFSDLKFFSKNMKNFHCVCVSAIKKLVIYLTFQVELVKCLKHWQILIKVT